METVALSYMLQTLFPVCLLPSDCVCCCSSREASQVSTAEPQAWGAKQEGGSERAEAGESGT